MKTQENSSNTLIFRYDFSGPGVIRAVQESVKTRTNVSFVCDRDQMGNVVRVGYFLVSRETNEPVNQIQWFKKEEVKIEIKESPLGIPDTGHAKVNFTHPRKTEKQFSVLLPIAKNEYRLRCVFRVEKDSTKNFVIMLDRKVLSRGKYSWKWVVRYDCAHGFLHKDILDKSGKKVVKKEKLPTQNKSDAITFIINELLSDIKHLGILLINTKNTEKKLKISASQVIADIRKTEETIRTLFDSPEVFEQIESSMVAYSVGKTSIILVKR